MSDIAEKKKPKVRSLGEIKSTLGPKPVPMLGEWFYEANQTMLYAPTGIGKSFVAMSMALVIAGGGTLMGWKADRPRKVLYVDGEMDLHELVERAEMLADGIEGIDKGLAFENLQMLAFRDQEPGSWFIDLDEERSREFIEKEARRGRFDLVILDNFSTLVSVLDENAASSMDTTIDLMRNLQRARCAVMLVHHARKTNGGDGSYRGSSKLSVTFNNIIRLDAPKERPLDGSAAFTIVWEKVRSKRTDEVAERKVQLVEGRWEHEQAIKPEVREYVNAVKSRKYATDKEIAKALKISPASVSRRRNEAVDVGLVNREKIKELFADAREDRKGFADDDVGEDDWDAGDF
ncbi:ATP-binding protein [Roseospira navarrensis]|uniref:AAA family ATPase n=1 Tax=Roseospira navarrensis TaxID=140058 RepID=A0A7X1ZE76_9PROT|nr:AAA family ATPase [Roseospira navarrensis]MQX35956.1 AAA family ATPase [Roseospira navarrensis]